MGESNEFLTELRCELESNEKDYSFEKPKVSIIVPAYNVADYIYYCLESLINQTLKDYKTKI